MKTKHILFSIMILFLFGCSRSVDLGWNEPFPQSDKTYFSPPSWIQGVWANNAISYHRFKFTDNDFIVHYDISYGTGVSYNERINILGTAYLSATEQISSTEYRITILHLSSNTFDYNFKKVSENEISCHYEANEWDEVTIEDFTLSKIE